MYESIVVARLVCSDAVRRFLVGRASSHDFLRRAGTLAPRRLLLLLAAEQVFDAVRHGFAEAVLLLAVGGLAAGVEDDLADVNGLVQN